MISRLFTKVSISLELFSICVQHYKLKKFQKMSSDSLAYLPSLCDICDILPYPLECHVLFELKLPFLNRSRSILWHFGKNPPSLVTFGDTFSRVSRIIWTKPAILQPIQMRFVALVPKERDSPMGVERLIFDSRMTVGQRDIYEWDFQALGIIH